MIGKDGDYYVAIEGAWSNVLSYYSLIAKDHLAESPTCTRIILPNADKKIVKWIYGYMMAGEADLVNDLEFDNLGLTQLITTYAHASALNFKSLMKRSSARICFLFKEAEKLPVPKMPSTSTMQDLMVSAPHLVKPAIMLIATHILRPLVEPTVFIQQYLDVQDLGPLIEDAVKEKLGFLIERSKWYYGLPGQQRHSQYLEQTVYKKAIDKPSIDAAHPPPLTRPPDRMKTCFICGEPGHLARSCTAKSRSPSNTTNTNKTPSTNSPASYYRKSIIVKSNGEGITACDQKIYPGQVTRLGLKI